jgi:uncharacterized protein YeeX (DUF496 family)
MHSFLILRHDVDSSLKAAFKMAKVERELGIISTFFVLLSSRLYNVFDEKHFFFLKRISDMGHEIGLHYDLIRYKSYGHPLKETLLTEINILERLIGKKVYSIASHNPFLSDDPFKSISNYTNAYALIKDDDIFYVSDSCRAWQIEDVHILITKNPKKVQLLIHPSHWTENVGNRYSLIDKIISDLEKEIEDYKLKWKELQRNMPRVTEYDKNIKKQKELLNFYL